MKRISIVFTCLVTVLLSTQAYGMGESTYVVKKGDTLSGIAHEHLGKGNRWKDLAEWNSLDVEWKDGIAYVWLRIGQEIKLSKQEKKLTSEEFASYHNNTRKLMEQEIFRMAGIKDPYSKSSGDPSNIYEVRLNMESIPSLLANIKEIGNLIDFLNCQIRYKMVDEIISKALMETRYPFKDSNRLWENHRKMCLLLLAILDIESNGNFVEGSYGEWGPYQIKPTTYCLTMGLLPSKENIESVEKLLMVDHTAGLNCAYEILVVKKDIRSALEFYNKGSAKHHYASKVLDSFYKMLDKAGKMDKWE